MANWRFFQETGKVGGTANPSDKVYYIDTYSGDDANVGSNAAPLKTIQQALDVMSSGGADIVLAGRFNEGDFVNRRNEIGIIYEGLVIFDGTGKNDFNPMLLSVSIYGGSRFAGITERKYGKGVIQNFNGAIRSGGTFSAAGGFCYNTTFINCVNIFPAGNMQIISSCVFINSTINNAYKTISSVWEKNTLINSFWSASNGSFIFRSNYFDSTSKTNHTTNNTWDYNFFEGTLADKIVYSSVSYSNTEAFKIANPTKAINDLPSTTVPLFNDVANEDYTLQEASPLSKRGHDKQPIGAFNVADISETNPNSAKFDYVNIDVSEAGEITLISDGVGTATTKALYHHQIAPKKRVITTVLSPNLEQNFGLGEVMGSDLASNNTPTKTDIEIQYSTDTGTLVDGVAGSDDDYNGTWLRVAVGEQPFHDTVNNVGSDDPLFDIANAVPIAAKYVKMRITLRSNEIQI